MKKLGFGMMRLPVLDEKDRSTVDIEEVIKMVDLYMGRGFTYFDTAHRYNDEMSEPVLCEALSKRYPRESFILADKITLNYIKKAEEQEPFLKKQLETCGVDYFDYYLIHNLGPAWYPAAQRFKTFEFIKKMKDEGYARHIGFSFHGTADVLEQILRDHPETEIVQLQINYLDWKDGGIQSQKCYEVARKHGKPVVVMEPVKGGSLVNLPNEVQEMLRYYNPEASLASWAIRFAASLDGVFMVLSGMSTREQVEDNTGYMKDFHPLSSSELAVLEKAAAIISSQTAIACTACYYCTTECPQNIAIPDYFGLYNNMKRLKNTGYMYNQTVYYTNLIQTHGKASDCVRCGLCEKNCPQHLKIRDLLQDISEALEGAAPVRIS
jgi:predicted aldo/keto reductase-like oxidoreductase